MGQGEILEFLEKQPTTWFSTTEIRKGIGNSSTITRPLRALRAHCLVEHKWTKKYPMTRMYRLKNANNI